MPANQKPEVAEPAGLVTTADRRIETLTPLPRQALLLSAIEGFSMDQIGPDSGGTVSEPAAPR